MAKKKKSALRLLVINLIILTVTGFITYLISNQLNQSRFVRYDGFDINMPVNFAIHGIDVSHHQSTIDWEEVKAMQVKNIRIGFSFIKATEGVGTVDNTFKKNWFNAKNAGLPRGAYHFFVASKSGKTQAENFIETVDLQKGDLPPVLDVEVINGTSKKDLQARLKEWLDTVEGHYNVKPIIYTNVVFYETYLAGEFDSYPLWVAHYLVQDKPRITRNWIMWQHSEKGHVNGIDAFVDFNAFNGDSTDFKRLLIK
ncbi:MAG: glycoside hydrolase family 25 protein [Chitinophagaceae bacterium]|nr:glycoside hydrolase family 25 protein [Chitinophagaceae bacterium]